MDDTQSDDLDEQKTKTKTLFAVDARYSSNDQDLDAKCPGWKGDAQKEEEIGDIDHSERNKPSYVVPDGGWGWLVALGGFIITMLLSSLGPCFGILFSRYLLELGASSITTAWIFNAQLFIWHLMGPLVRPLSAEFGWRPVGLLGVFLCSTSIILSAFSPSSGFLFFSFSLLSGVGGGLVVSMCYIIIPQYFDRRRGLANAIMMVGLCMGQILGAPFVRYLQDHHGFLGSTLIFGAIMLNGCVGASFFHPVEWHLKKVKGEMEKSAPAEEEEKEANDPLMQKRRNTHEYESRLISSCAGEAHTEEYYKERVTDCVCTNRTQTEEKNGSVRARESSYESLASDDTTIQVKDPSTMSISFQEVYNSQLKKKTNSTPLLPKLFSIFARVGRSTISDLKILRSRRGLIIALGNMLCMNAYFNFVMMVPFAMQAANFTLQDSAWCITVMGIFNLLSRIVISVLSDWSRFNMRICCMVGYAVLATVMFVFPLLKEVKWMVSLMGVFGCGLAATISLLHLVMIQYMGMEHLAAMFGSTCLLIGIGFPTFGPLIGFIRDYSGSYAVSMWILSALTFSAFGLWIFMPAAVTYDKRKMAKKLEKKKENSEDTAPTV